MVLGTSLPEFNPEKVPLLPANYLVGGRIEQISLKKVIFPKFLAAPLPENPNATLIAIGADCPCDKTKHAQLNISRIKG
ncbi:MAG: hypothetical protein P8075_18520 [Deltaproteobacteria bacterium]|jgi:hypothetical protein